MYARLVMCATIAVLGGILAQLGFWIGPVPYTFQNASVVLAGLLLDAPHAFLSMALYVLFVAIGLPVAAGFRGGLYVILGPTGGYIVGFMLSAPMMSLLRGWYLRLRGRKLGELGLADYLALLLLSLIAVLPTYVLGFLVFSYYALGNERFFFWAQNVVSSMGGNVGDKFLVVFIASVLIFVPQDLLMDHVIALALAKYIYKIAAYKGLKLS
jgi:biotin transport system substrate-specific component